MRAYFFERSLNETITTKSSHSPFLFTFPVLSLFLFFWMVHHQNSAWFRPLNHFRILMFIGIPPLVLHPFREVGFLKPFISSLGIVLYFCQLPWILIDTIFLFTGDSEYVGMCGTYRVKKKISRFLAPILSFPFAYMTLSWHIGLESHNFSVVFNLSTILPVTITLVFLIIWLITFNRDIPITKLTFAVHSVIGSVTTIAASILLIAIEVLNERKDEFEINFSPVHIYFLPFTWTWAVFISNQPKVQKWFCNRKEEQVPEDFQLSYISVLFIFFLLNHLFR